MTALLADIRRWFRGLSPFAILLIGWLTFMLYAYPGFMSFESVDQLLQARASEISAAYPPLMTALWQVVDCVFAGPFGMLVIQTVCFLAGAYLLLKRFMPARPAAFCASLLLVVPPVAAVMAVIWSDSQMTGFLLLGTALVLSPRGSVKIGSLALFIAATAMRIDAAALTFSLIVLLFAWTPTLRWYKRYPIALLVWVAVTLAAIVVNNALTTADENSHPWHDTIAPSDIAGTLRNAPPLSDAELQPILANTPLLPTHDIQDAAQTELFYDMPRTAAERAAIGRAWKELIPTYPAAYLEYRLQLLIDRIRLHGDDIASTTYVWFTDVNDPDSAAKLGFSARPAGIQTVLRDGMRAAGSTELFRPYVYLLLALVLLPFCFRDRELLALGLSGLVGELALFFTATSLDYRYSIWLVVTAIMVAMMLAKRNRTRRDSTG
ncbi:MAG TPA: hypothetical protein VFV99_31805 [Kofleriaceae bacterium]|nr:hypothetical protein [Kofleriaceae bacterium]